MRIALFLLVMTYCMPFQGQIGTTENLPELVKFVAPAYPRYAKDHRMQGKAVIRVVVATDGQVVESKTVTAHPLFGDYARTAVEKWKFKPIAAQQTFEITFEFVFYDEKECLVKGGQPITPETHVSAELPNSVTIQTGLQCVSTSTD